METQQAWEPVIHKKKSKTNEWVDEQQARIDALKQIGMDMAVGRWPPDPTRVFSAVELHWIRTGAKRVMDGMHGEKYKQTQARFQRIYEQLK